MQKKFSITEGPGKFHRRRTTARTVYLLFEKDMPDVSMPILAQAFTVSGKAE
jgi:hypothetical protein